MEGLVTKERDIDGLRVTTTKLPSMRGLVLGARIVPIIAPLLGAIGPLLEAAGPLFSKMAAGQATSLAEFKATLDLDAVRGMLADLDPEAIKSALAAFGAALGTLSDDGIEALTMKLLAGTMVGVGNERRSLLTAADIQAALPNLYTLLKTMWFSIEVNFFPTGAGAPGASSPKAAPRST